jgi:hypothetical protein
VTELGITTETKALYLKADLPIDLTDESIIKLPVQPILLLISAAGISTEYVPPVHGKSITSACAGTMELPANAKIIKNRMNDFFMSKS